MTYRAQSSLTRDDAGSHLDLATALAMTPNGPVANPHFFSGDLTRPEVAAAGLLAVADVAAHRYADAGLMRRIASLDPVVTAGGDRLRFESFSACNGVHARLDLLSDALGNADVGAGTTNVDINLPLRTALARISGKQPLHLSVGRDQLRATSASETHIEGKVNLPDRWVRGFAEMPALTRLMTLRGELRGPAITQFFSALPRVAPPGPTIHILTDRLPWRISNRPIDGAVPLPGASRLRAVDRIARHTVALSVYVGDNGTTSWIFDLGDSRLTLVVSPDPYRGFSGEGTLLAYLTQPDGEILGRRLLPSLSWSPVIDPGELARSAGMPTREINIGLGWLSAAGRLGWDQTEAAWFHRELPIDTDRILRRNPRLVSANALVADGAVTAVPEGWKVRRESKHACCAPGENWPFYLVTRELICECAWYREHPGTRGPCKHILAALIVGRSTRPNKR